MSTAQTPICFIALCFVSYILSGLFSLVGSNCLVSLSNVLMSLSILCLFTWCYSRYTGQYRWLGESLDMVARRFSDVSLAVGAKNSFGFLPLHAGTQPVRPTCKHFCMLCFYILLNLNSGFLWIKIFSNKFYRCFEILRCWFIFFGQTVFQARITTGTELGLGGWGSFEGCPGNSR